MHLTLTITSAMALCFVSMAHADMNAADDFRDWVTARNMQPAALIALDEGGTILASIGVNADTNTPFPIASISKTFAGQCALFMVDQEMVSLNDPISRYLPWTNEQGAVTLSQLLTHSSGFGPDATQMEHDGALFSDPQLVDEIIQEVSSRSLGFLQDTHHYNNENYLVLEGVMAEVVGSDVFSWCHRNVPMLAPLISLRLNENLRAIGIAGGLEISASERARFFYSLNEDGFEAWPVVWYGSNNSYGPGVVMQAVRDGTNLLHAGSICVAGGPNLGSFAVRFAQGTSVAIVYSGCAEPEDYSVLNKLALDLLDAAGSGH